MSVTFTEWTQSRSIVSFGTNAGADELPFQTWRNFKEAYPPELIARAVEESVIPVRECLDPFGARELPPFPASSWEFVLLLLKLTPFLRI